MHPADHYPASQTLFQLEGTLTLESEAEVEATITSLKQHFEAVRQHEVRRMRGRLGQLSSTQENAIESLTQGIVDQILHAPITALKATSEDNDSFALIEIVNRVFSLSVDPEHSRTV